MLHKNLTGIVMHKFCDNKFQQEEDSDMMSAWKGAEYFRIVK